MKAKELPEDILLEVFPHLPPFYMDFTLPMVCRSYRRLVGPNIAKLPKHTVSINCTDRLPNGAELPRGYIGWFSYGDGRNEWARLTREGLKNLLVVDSRLVRISRVEFRKIDTNSAKFIANLLYTTNGKTAVPVITVAITENFGQQCLGAVKKLRSTCLEFHQEPSDLPVSAALTCSGCNYLIFRFALHTELYYYYSPFVDHHNAALHKAAGKHLIYHFSHICYSMVAARLGNGENFEDILHSNKHAWYSCEHAQWSREQNEAADLVEAIAKRFQIHDEQRFPDDLLLFYDEEDREKGAIKESFNRKWEKILGESNGQPATARVEKLVAEEEIPSNDYYRRLEGCTWEVRWVKREIYDGGKKKYLRVMRKVGGSDDIVLAVHFKVFDEAGRGSWERLNG